MRPSQLALTGAAAAALHGLEGFRDWQWSERWATPSNGTRRSGVVRTTSWTEPAIINGIYVTQVPLTLAMLGDEVKAVPRWNGDHRLIEPFDLCELAVEHAIRNGLTTDAMLRSYALGGRRGTHLRKVLATRPVESPATESYFETRSIQFLRELGYEDVWRQVWVTGNVVRGFKRHRVDLVIPVWSRYSDLRTQPPVVLKPWHGVLFELDGKAWHDNSESFENDHDRNLAYDSWGFVHSAVTPRQLDHSQQFVANAIEQGLRRVESLR